MPIETTSMEKASSFEKLKLMEVGPEKGGKSRLAATARKPILVHDFDQRKEALAGMPGVYVITYRDPVWPNQPTAFNDHLGILAKLESGCTLKDIDSNWPAEKPKTNVEDSIATMAKAAMNYSLYTSKDLRREINIGGMKFFTPYSYDGWGAEMNMVESAVLRLLAMPSDTIAVLHETAEEAPDSTEEKPKFTGRLAVFPARYKILLKYFNEVWRITRLGDKVTVQIMPDYMFGNAASNLKLMPQDVDQPNIEYLIQKSLSRK